MYPQLRSTHISALLLTGLLTAPALTAQQQWIAPAPDELKMTSLPGYPGAKAVILNRDELTDDDNHMRSRYFRIKILTEAGKDLGDVRIMFDRRSDGNGYSVSEVAGRTIQPDGTIIPFTGKPYEKVLERTQADRFTAKVFSMPAVQVGSIIEYRYKLRWEDNLFWSPDWDIQSDLYLKKGHFLWRPTNKDLRTTSRGHQSTTSALAWNSVLPSGQKLEPIHLPTGRSIIELNLADVEPFQYDEFMPPIQSFAYHVWFYYTPYHTPDEYWKTEGKYWSGEANKFASVSDPVRDAAREAIGGAASDEDKAKAIYRFTSHLENTDYTRKRDTAEEKAEGLKETKSAADVLRRKRGSSDQIAMTYVALARAAGLNASMVIAGDREQRLVTLSWLNFSQLSDVVAVISYNGADHFLDPGTPMVPYGHLHWTHTGSGAVRQTGKDTAIVQLPSEGYKFSHTTRIADVHLERDGVMSGTVNFTFEGSPATHWREQAMRTDDAGIRDELRKHLEVLMPGQTEVEVKSLDGITNVDGPLKVAYNVHGRIGTLAGSRIVVPSDLFVVNAPPHFTHEKRDQAIYYPYPEFLQDATRFTYPAEFTLESAPAENKVGYKTEAVYATRSKQTGNSITVWRDLVIADIFFPLETYPDLRKFYTSFEQNDHTSIVFKRTPTEKASTQ